MKKRLLGLTLALSLSWSGSAMAAQNTYNWIDGGKKVEMKNIVSIDLDPSLVMLNAEDTIKLSKEAHDIPSGREIGSVYPKDDTQNWEVIFEYNETGHIKDDEKKKIDANAILKSYKKGTEEANKDKQPGDRIYVTGWDVEPFYDEKTHNLSWSLKLEDEKKQPFLNYNVRLLTRQGTVSVILVSDPEHLEADRKVLNEKILPKLEVKAGQKYEEFDASKDKTAEYGLSALILGGAGLVAAKKVGLLATIALFGKKFFVLILAALGGIGALVKRLFRRKQQESETQQPSAVQPPSDQQGETPAQ
ncbi:DUF2167 domain-containing protein [Paenibacillus rigui]|nr:DUF2167 domain-containing protein [Paenibacillus rigui]